MAKAFSNKVPLMNGYLDEIVRRFELSTKDNKGKETRKGRDIAFEIFSIALVLEKSFQDVYDNVLVQGDRDGGMDGIYYEKVDDYAIIMHVFQCKNRKGLKRNELNKFRGDFKDIFEDGNVLNMPNIEDLEDKILEYQQLTANLISITPILYFLYSGENEDTAYADNALLSKRYHNPSERFYIWDSDALYQKISRPDSVRANREALQFTFKPSSSSLIPNDVQDLYSYSIGEVRAVNFRVEAIELCRLIDEEIKLNKVDDGLFAANIRGFLGAKVKANQKMQATLSHPQEAIYFPFLNNGVTIICDKLQIPLAPQNAQYLVPTTNPVIVNGMQTSKVLYQAYQMDREQLKGVYINLRVYETNNPELVDKITDATNTQSPIYYKDKVSNKDFNKWAQELFRTQDVYYLTKRGEMIESLRAKKEQIDNDLVLKFWFATFYEQPEVAKSSKAAVLEMSYEASHNEHHPLYTLYKGERDSPLYMQLLVSYFIYKKITQEESVQKEQYSFIGHAKELLCYGVYKSLDDTELSKVYHNDAIALEQAYQTALQHLSKAFGETQQEYQSKNKPFSIPGYFKSARSRYDYNRAAGISETTVGLITELLQKRIEP